MSVTLKKKFTLLQKPVIDTGGGGGGGGGVASVVAGTGIAVDATDPANPVVSATGGGGGGGGLDWPTLADHTYTSGELTASDSWYGTASVHFETWTAPCDAWLMVLPPTPQTPQYADLYVWKGTTANTDYPDGTSASGAFSGQQVVDAGWNSSSDTAVGHLFQVEAGQDYTLAWVTWADATGETITRQEWADALAILDGLGFIPDYPAVGFGRIIQIEQPSGRYLPEEFYLYKRGQNGDSVGAFDGGAFVFKTRVAPSASGKTGWAVFVDWNNTVDIRARREFRIYAATVMVTTLSDGSQVSYNISIDDATCFPVASDYQSYQQVMVKNGNNGSGSTVTTTGSATGVSFSASTGTITLATAHEYEIIVNFNFERRPGVKPWSNMARKRL